MAVSAGPDIVENGLVLCLDAANRRSYSGTGTGWFDLSGNVVTTNLINGITYSTNNAGNLLLDGTDDYIIIPEATIPSNIFASNTSFTVIAFLKKIPKATDGTFILGYRNLSDNNNDIGLIIYGNTNNTTDYGAIVGAGTGTGLYISNRGDVVNTENYSMYTMVYTYESNSSQRVDKYYNATLIRGVTGSGTSGYQKPASSRGGGIVIGTAVNALTGSQHSLSGNLASIMIYNRALSSQEISQNFNALRGRYNI